MQEDPIKAAEAEIKKWIDLTKQMLDEARKQAEKLAAEQKAIGENALAANKEMMKAEADRARHDQTMEKLDKLADRLDKVTTQKELDEVKQAANEIAAENGIEGPGRARQNLMGSHRTGRDVDVTELNEVAGPDVGELFGDVDVSDLNEVAGPEVESEFGADLGEVDLSELNEVAGPEVSEAFSSMGEGVANAAGAVGGSGAPAMGEGVAGVGGGGKERVGDSLGWVKGEKGWKNQEGLSVKEMGNKVAALGKSLGGAGGPGG